MRTTATTQWWDKWPGAKKVDETYPRGHRSWVQNHLAHWGQPDLPAGRAPVPFASHRIDTPGACLHVFLQYELLYARIQDHRRVSEIRRTSATGLAGNGPDAPVLITGTPGIGKSVFIYYYAIRLMRQATPFVVYAGDWVYLVNPDGVMLAPMNAIQHDTSSFLEAVYNVPFLFDVDWTTTVPSESFVTCAPFFFVHAASPDPAHFEWTKGFLRTRRFVMNPPTTDELITLLRDGRPAHLQNDQSYDQLAQVIEAYGPNLRIILEALDRYVNPLARFEEAVAVLRASDLEALSNAATRPETHVLVKTICPAPPCAYGPGWLGPDRKVYVVANHTAMRLILSRWVCAELQRILEMLRRLSTTPQTALSAAWLFESWAHARVCESGGLTLHPMTESCGEYVVNAASSSAVYFSRLRSHPLGTIGDASATNTYYIPTATDNPTFDAFCLLDNDVYAFQMTLARAHTLKETGLDILRIGMRQSMSKNLVFVIPQGRPFSFTAPSRMPIPDLKFWVMYIDLDESASSAIELTYDYWDTNERPEVVA